MNHVLSTDDFEKMRKLRNKKAVEMRTGRKRTAEEAWLEETDSEEEEDRRGRAEVDEGIIDANGIAAFVNRRKKGKIARMQSIFDGRTDREDFKAKTKKKTGGKSNAEQARMKPHQMLLMKKKQRAKSSAENRIRVLKNTIAKAHGGKTEKRGGKKQNRRKR